MTNSICDGLLADPQQGKRNFRLGSARRSRTTSRLRPNQPSTIVRAEASSAISKSILSGVSGLIGSILCLASLWLWRTSARARSTCSRRPDRLRRNGFTNCLQLKANSGKTLGQGVMDLVCQAFTLCHDSLEPPALHAAIDDQGKKCQHQDSKIAAI